MDTELMNSLIKPDISIMCFPFIPIHTFPLGEKKCFQNEGWQ